MGEEEKELDETAKCQYRECEMDPEYDSQYCIFHMREEQKEEKRLWKLCMDQFYELMRTGESNFEGFVLKDVNIPANVGREIKQVIDFSKAVFVGESVFSDIKNKAIFELGVYFEGATFSGEASFEYVTFSSEAYFKDATFS